MEGDPTMLETIVGNSAVLIQLAKDGLALCTEFPLNILSLSLCASVAIGIVRKVRSAIVG